MAKEALVDRIEAQYFLDYVTFLCGWRTFLADTMYKKYLLEPDIQGHMEFMEIAVVREFYASIEDLGAYLGSFLKWRNKDIHTPLEYLLIYRPSEVILDKLFQQFQISSGKDLFERLRLSDLVPKGWGVWYPDIDVLVALNKMCDYFSGECRESQCELGVRAYNKIKHGLLVVTDGSRYVPSAECAPAALVLTPGRSRGESITITKICNSPLMARRLIGMMARHSFYLQLLLALYMCHMHQDFLIQKGFQNSSQLFGHESFTDLIDFLRGKPPIFYTG